AVIFDWDNTLIDSWATIHDAQNHTLAAFGHGPWTMDETRKRVRGSMRDTYPRLFGERWQEAGKIFHGRFAERHLETLAPLPGAEVLLADLVAMGAYLAVVSNKKGDFLRTEVAQLGWSQFFGRVVGAHDAPRDKPSPEPVFLALKDSGIEPGEAVWFVGDADIDVECATRAGCVPVLLRETPPDDEEFIDYPKVVHLTDCLTLSKLLRTL
ncbi:MAG: HAD-IA family hydrolase, partial [Rhodospirillales bacterium]|nr:HAD-IA family hydrolase [Rhodospirillales bacterium]